MRLTPALPALLVLLALPPARAAERAADAAPQVPASAPAPAAPAIPQLPQSLVAPVGAGGAGLPSSAALPQGGLAAPEAEASLPAAGVPAAGATASPVPPAAGLSPKSDQSGNGDQTAPRVLSEPAARSAGSPRGEAARTGRPSANAQARALGAGAGRVRGALAAPGGAESAKRLSDAAFDRSDAAGPSPPDAPAGGGRSGRAAASSRGTPYRAALMRLGVPKAAIAALERGGGGRGARLATQAAAMTLESSDHFSDEQALAFIAQALLEEATPAGRAQALEDATAAGLRLPPLDIVWRSRLDYLAQVLFAGDDAAKLGPLSRDQRFALLPRALRADVEQALAFHARGAVPSAPLATQEPASERGPPASAAALVNEGLSSGQITRAQAEQWLRAAYEDPLTGLPNRLYLDDHLETLVSKNRTLLTFKLDYLKEVNDGFDHEAGNKLLEAVAAVTEGVIGDDGRLVRRSPTGFAAFLDAPPEDALLVGEALRAAVEKQLGPLERVLDKPAAGLSGTVSIGEAPIDGHIDAPDAYKDALARAERARTFAKEVGGGDRTAVDDDGPRLAERRTLSEIAARLRQRRSLARMAARIDELRGATGRTLTFQLASQAVAASKLVEEAPAPLKRRLFDVLYRDRLSGLRNRRWLFDNLGALFRPGGVTHYVALDLDHFGSVNEKLGEERADLLLKELGALLEERAAARGATALHLSGEEFALLAGDGVDADALAEDVREQVQESLGARAKARYGLVEPGTDRPLAVTVSLGVASVEPAQGPQPTLTLATAMAEAMLQRAKSAGRNRVESDEEQANVLSRLSGLIRLDSAVRQAVDKLLGGPAGKPPAHPFDDRFKTRAEVVSMLGFDPARRSAVLLSDAGKSGSWVGREQAPGGGSVVVKIALESTVVNEMAMRGVLESFEIFSESLRAPRAVAYRRWFRRPVMVMEDVPNDNATTDSRHLTFAQRSALAMFALTFGVHDLNPGAFLRVGWSHAYLTDFERARDPITVPPANRFANISETPWVSRHFLNDLADFRPAYERWRSTFARPAARAELVEILRRSGVPDAEIDANIALFAENLRRLPEVLAADVRDANRYYREDCLRAGLSERQTLGLSELNRKAQLSPDGGAARDVLRFLLGRDARAAAFHVEPEEAAALARRKGVFSYATKERLMQVAQNGGLRALDGRLIGPLRARAAFVELQRLLAR